MAVSDEAAALARDAAAARAFAECGARSSFLRSSRASSTETVVPPDGAGSGSLMKEDMKDDGFAGVAVVGVLLEGDVGKGCCFC